MPAKTREAFISVFARLPQRVVWKWEAARPVNMPANVLTPKWLPQQDLLGNIRMRYKRLPMATIIYLLLQQAIQTRDCLYHTAVNWAFKKRFIMAHLLLECLLVTFFVEKLHLIFIKML